jgi:hypothetical protein
MIIPATDGTVVATKMANKLIGQTFATENVPNDSAHTKRFDLDPPDKQHNND